MIIRTRNKPFNVYNEEGKFIGTWKSQTECAKDLKIGATNISACLLNKYNTINGYIFIYNDENTKERLKEILLHIKSKTFEVFIKKTLEFIGRWSNKAKCGRDLKLDKGNINKCLSNKRKSLGGYIFKYIT